MAAMPRSPLLIVKTGSAFARARERFGDFDDWFRRAIGESEFEYLTVSVDHGEEPPAIDDLPAFAGVIVTGSPAMVSHREAWSERTARWLRAVISDDVVPVLGVCYGHQLMAHALGGRVGPNPAGRRMGTRELLDIDTRDALLGGLAGDLNVHVTHLEAVLEPPAGAAVIARTEGDANHALRFGPRSWGVQFHPEFDRAIMRCYVDARADLLEAEGFDSRSILAAVTDAPAGPAVLGRFARLCRQTEDEAHATSA
jgi:GMP synthase (glutamine-hydrolysing)